MIDLMATWTFGNWVAAAVFFSPFILLVFMVLAGIVTGVRDLVRGA